MPSLRLVMTPRGWWIYIDCRCIYVGGGGKGMGRGGYGGREKRGAEGGRKGEKIGERMERED